MIEPNALSTPLISDALVRSESGGNWGALNSAVGAGGHVGHGGRLQFGTARLEDAARAGVIPRMTAQEFAQQPPEVQMRVENWHFQDIDRQAERLGLTQYIGQTVAGVPITQQSIRNMAHLGGIGGAQRFLTSGGQSNPRDANGTSLLDYARMGASEAYGGQPHAQSAALRRGGNEQPVMPQVPNDMMAGNALALPPEAVQQVQERQSLNALQDVLQRPIYNFQMQGGSNALGSML